MFLCDSISQSQADAEVLLTVKEFAHLFHRHPEAVRRKARAGWDLATKLGGQWVVRMRERDVLAAQNRRHVASSRNLSRIGLTDSVE